jgi:hypothetical protein
LPAILTRQGNLPASSQPMAHGFWQARFSWGRLLMI